jgi:hypothetical protein
MVAWLEKTRRLMVAWLEKTRKVGEKRSRSERQDKSGGYV